MWQLFKHKEKNSVVINLLYLVSLFIYWYTITMMDFAPDTFQFYPFVMWCIIIETFRHSIINMSYYFANDNELGLNQAITSRLKTHLQLLSIKMNDFVLYNVIYTVLRLLPFIIITAIFNRSLDTVTFISIFSALYLLKALIGPMTTYINSILINLTLHNKELTKKERMETFFDTIQNTYQQIDIKLFKLMRLIYTFSSLALYIIIYFFVFRFVFEIFNWNLYITSIVGVVSYINILVYGLYLNNLERKQDHVLYQE